jgi:anti-sigma regulatory factor (Ser/Thr protein kinase)
VIEADVESALREARFALPAAPESAGLARKMAAAVLHTWVVPVDEDAAILMLSEVVTNALVHAVAAGSTGAAVIGVELVERSCGLHVEVHDPDQGNGNKVALAHGVLDQMSEFGRGLQLVEALSDNWGCKSTDAGKFVFFDIDAPDAALADERWVGAGRAAGW